MVKTRTSKLWFVAVVALLLGACGKDQPPAPPPTGPGQPAPARAEDPSPGPQAAPGGPQIFVDEARTLGLDFVHWNGRSGELYFCETVGSGAALFDMDGDGDLDLYVVQGSMLGPGKTPADSVDPVPAQLPASDRLFRNDLVIGKDGKPEVSFTDITAEAGLPAGDYGMGVAAGDYDGDGRLDLYVTAFGANRLLRNLGGGKFADVTAESGTVEPRWSTSAAFADYDGDGRADLFVCNYVDFSFANHKPCFNPSSARDYCGPRSYDPVPDRLFRNAGDGRFEDVSDSAQISRDYGGALGVVCVDFNGDALLDFYVANDGSANQLWINQGDGTFTNEALLAGCAYNAQGAAEASMGVDAGDYDGDGDEDIFLAHLGDETNTLYVNDGSGMFEDRSLVSGLAIVSRPFTAFGTAWVDFDNDGWLDLLTANGAVKVIPEQLRRGDDYPLKQTNQLFRNLGGGSVKFEDVTPRAGASFAIPEVSRGAAFGDIDNDGDTDVILVNNGGPLRALMNQVGSDLRWIGLAFVDGSAGRPVEGMRIEVQLADGPTLWRRVRAVASYLCANDSRVLVGLGAGGEPEVVRAHWPGGEVEEWRGLSAGRYHTLIHGEGER